MHDPHHFEDLIRQISAERSKSKDDKPKIFIKFSPDEDDDTIYEIN